MEFPRHECGLFLTHNECKDYYETVEEWLKDEHNEEHAYWPDGEWEKAIETNEIWVLQWYPDTPVGFHCVAASTLETCLSEALRIEREEG